MPHPHRSKLKQRFRQLVERLLFAEGYAPFVHYLRAGQDAYGELGVSDGMTASVELERLMFDGTPSEDDQNQLKASLP